MNSRANGRSKHSSRTIAWQLTSRFSTTSNAKLTNSGFESRPMVNMSRSLACRELDDISTAGRAEREHGGGLANSILYLGLGRPSRENRSMPVKIKFRFEYHHSCVVKLDVDIVFFQRFLRVGICAHTVLSDL
jgi:hypothetical protein